MNRKNEIDIFKNTSYNVLDTNIKKGCGTVALFFFD